VHAARRRPQGETQWRGRCVLRRGQRTEHEKQGFAGLGRQVQAAQDVAAHVVGPEQQLKTMKKAVTG